MCSVQRHSWMPFDWLKLKVDFFFFFSTKRLYFLHLGPQLLSRDAVSLDSVDHSCSPLLSTFTPQKADPWYPIVS